MSKNKKRKIRKQSIYVFYKPKNEITHRIEIKKKTILIVSVSNLFTVLIRVTYRNNSLILYNNWPLFKSIQGRPSPCSFYLQRHVNGLYFLFSHEGYCKSHCLSIYEIMLNEILGIILISPSSSSMSWSRSCLVNLTSLLSW